MCADRCREGALEWGSRGHVVQAVWPRDRLFASRFLDARRGTRRTETAADWEPSPHVSDVAVNGITVQIAGNVAQDGLSSLESDARRPSTRFRQGVSA